MEYEVLKKLYLNEKKVWKFITFEFDSDVINVPSLVSLVGFLINVESKFPRLKDNKIVKTKPNKVTFCPFIFERPFPRELLFYIMNFDLTFVNPYEKFLLLVLVIKMPFIMTYQFYKLEVRFWYAQKTIFYIREIEIFILSLLKIKF